MKNLYKKIQENDTIQMALAIFCVVIFVFSSSLFVLTKNNFFPVLNFVILLVSFLISFSKYRIFFLAFFSPLFKCFNFYESSFSSSLYTVGIMIYELSVLIELVVKKEKIQFSKFSYILFFVCYVFVISIINFSGIGGILKTVSSISYFLLPFFCLLDARSIKNENIIFAFSLGIILANLFSFTFLFLIKSKGIQFLEIFMPSYIKAYTSYSGTFFRFGGLRGDSNGNCLYILLASSLLLVLCNKKTKRRTAIILMAAMQPFAILGGSKSYYIGLMILLFGYLIFKFHKKKYFVATIVGLILGLIVIFILGYSFFYPILRRLLSTDLRRGVLSGLTTERFDIFINYVNNLMTNPLYFMFGHGARSELLSNTDFHNTLIQIIWDFGLVGLILFLFAYYRFYYEAIKKEALTILSLLVFVFYVFALHMLYQEGIYIVFICLTLVKRAKKRKKGAQDEKNQIAYIEV